MATTDTRPGFRLPWASDHRSADDQAAEETVDQAVDAAAPASDAPETPHAPDTPEDGPEADVTPTTEATTPAWPTTTGASADAGRAGAPAGSPSAGYRPTKFLADLTKAMQVAAQAEREETLARYRADAKAFTEQVRADTADRAADYRKQADDDVAAIRDWSKAEMARIREETEHRIGDRKGELERQLQRHADRIDQAVGRVEGRVEEFEAEMARFFERLLAVDDPTAFAAMAASMPEPPPFASDPDAEAPHVGRPEPAPAAVVESLKAPVDPAWADLPEVAAAATEAEPAAVVEQASEATAELADVPEPTAEATHHQDLTSLADEPVDPRISALGLTPSEFAAAEAEAAVDAGAAASGDGSDDGGPVELVDEASVAARIAGLIPAEPSDADHSGTIVNTQVTVLGLVSVASIAGFKRHLARVPGIQSVSVSSGPDGEFVFTTVHHDDVVLRDVITTLPGFQARVTDSGDGVLQVSARDPEAEA